MNIPETYEARRILKTGLYAQNILLKLELARIIDQMNYLDAQKENLWKRINDNLDYCQAIAEFEDNATYEASKLNPNIVDY